MVNCQSRRAFATTRGARYRIAMHEPISLLPSAAAIPSRLKIWTGRISLAAVAPFVMFVARFGRTVILSRLLAPGEFGITVAITIVTTTAELATDVGLEKFILLKSATDAPRALAAAHALQIVRGLLLARRQRRPQVLQSRFSAFPTQWRVSSLQRSFR